MTKFHYQYGNLGWVEGGKEGVGLWSVRTTVRGRRLNMLAVYSNFIESRLPSWWYLQCHGDGSG